MTRMDHVRPARCDTPAKVGGFGDGPGGLAPNGDLRIDDFAAPGGAIPYAFLIQRKAVAFDGPRTAPYGQIVVNIRGRDGQGQTLQPSMVQAEWSPDWTWEVTQPDGDIRNQARGRWYAQMACELGLTTVQVTDPEGQTFSQPLPSGGKSVIAGEFEMQNIRVDTVRQIAVDWASNGGNLSPLGGLPAFATFDLTGGMAPATAQDRLRLFATCADGTVFDDLYYPRIRLVVRADGLA